MSRGYYNNWDDYYSPYGECDKCYGIYKCDTGYGENRIRFLDIDGHCPVCDSDPREEHRRWFEDYCDYVFSDIEQEDNESSDEDSQDVVIYDENNKKCN